MSKKVVIIGGVAGGATAAVRLRRLDEFAEIIIIERGDYVSFANCGLPYYIGGVIKEKSKLQLVTPDTLNRRFNIDVRLNNEVISINKENKSVLVKERKKNEEYNLEYDNLILSPGAEPILPPFTGIEEVPTFSLRTIPDTFEIDEFITQNKPQHATVVGGGFIGLEMAENLRIRGLNVTVVELVDQVMINLDKEMAQFVHQELYLNDVDLVLGDGVDSFAKDAEGKAIVKTQSGKEILTDLIILAIGVKPESKLAKECGLDLGDRGHIFVNKNMRTSDEFIYAVGDAVQVTNLITNEPTAVPLAGPASKQGRIAADNITGRKSEYNGVLGAAVVKVFDITVAQVGLNEKNLKNSEIKFEKVYTYPVNHPGYYPNREKIAIKLLFEVPSGKILGVQAVGGKGTEKRVDIISTSIFFGGTVFDLELLEITYAPPFNNAKTPVNRLGYVASNMLKGDFDYWHWEEAEKIIEKNAYLLDVRREDEYVRGTIGNAVHINDLDLRKRIDEIPKDKEIYIFCEEGYRAYIAQRHLAQKGYKVKNLVGGYIFYKMSKATKEELKTRIAFN
ncbi:MAG: FAD-dependent oxidoreductase [Candidatus Heimdallarchaeota archaeon]|nr:FAD-dependent oxidoreductase [Candidatus Heimdallarchaeota archaeon]MCK4769737.1 FAD-dependent oxidoreductase [Candidatus Heimdallarchaeota archaeon]